MKQLNFTITDNSARKLNEIKKKLMIANNSDAVEQLIENVPQKIQDHRVPNSRARRYLQHGRLETAGSGRQLLPSKRG
jgi:hypothetical protein